MRGLHVVGISDDGTQVLLAASPDAARPSHALALDSRLRAAVNGEWRTDGKAESALSPKEIQARLRAGDSVEVVARAAGVSVARVMPFATPVLSERERIVEEARAAVPRRDRGDSPDIALGPLIDARLSETAGLKRDSVSWSARRREDGAWVVTLSYTARGGVRHAEWLWHPVQRQLRPNGAAATRLSAAESAGGRPKARPKPKAKSKAKSTPRGASSKSTPASAPTKRQGRTKRAAAATPAASVSRRQTTRSGRSRRPAVAEPAANSNGHPSVEPALLAAVEVPHAPPPRGPARPPTPIAPRPVAASWSDVLFGVADSQVVADAVGRSSGGRGSAATRPETGSGRDAGGTGARRSVRRRA